MSDVDPQRSQQPGQQTPPAWQPDRTRQFDWPVGPAGGEGALGAYWGSEDSEGSGNAGVAEGRDGRAGRSESSSGPECSSGGGASPGFGNPSGGGTSSGYDTPSGGGTSAGSGASSGGGTSSGYGTSPDSGALYGFGASSGYGTSSGYGALSGGGPGYPGARPPSPASAAAPRRRVLLALGGLTILASAGAAVGISVASSPSNNDPKTTTAAADIPKATAAPTTARRSASPSPTKTASATPTESATEAVATKPQYYVDNDGPMAIALTMDDGPHPVYTPQVLEVLRKYNIKATFNMIGRQVGSNLSLVREVSSEGHTITNHTWDHSDLTHLTFTQVCSQIDRCNEALSNANQHPTIFRAPYGNWSTAVFQSCAARNLRPVDWSVDPRDWDTANVDTAEIVHTVLTTTHPHDIILEHDGGGVRRNTVAALKIFIPKLLDEGYNFVAM